MFKLCGDDDTVMVPSEVRHIPDRLERILRIDEHSAGQPLKAAEDLQDILAVVGNGHGLTVWADVFKFLHDLPGLRVHHIAGTVRRFGIEHGDEHLAPVYRKAEMEGAGELA